MASPKKKAKPSTRPKRKPKGEDDKPQSERFKETARALGAERSGTLFERALRAIIPPRRTG
jgi:hypothetical protein